MDGEYKVALGAIALIVCCCTVVLIFVFIALWPQHELVAWSVLGLLVLVVLVLLIRSLNEMSLRRKRFDHRNETPLDAYGYPTILQEGQQPYYAGVRPGYRAQPHDGEGGSANGYE